MPFLGVQLKRGVKQHLYLQLYQQIKKAIGQGQLKEGQKLPAIRLMAEQLNLNNVTVVKAYQLLEEEGLVIKKVGSGTYIAPLAGRGGDWVLAEEEIELMNQGQISLQSDIINFATATPDPELFPIDDIKVAINYVLDRDGGKVFGYQDSQGYRPLRQAIEDYLARQGIKSQAKNIQVVSGAQQGIDILAKSFLDYGDVVFAEEPTYPGAISAFKSRGARIVSIPIQEDGLDIEALEARLAEYHPRFLYVMSTLQNPTGYSYSEEKKKRIIELSQRRNLTIVEDDSLSELYFKGQAERSLKSFDTAQQVIYIKSFSKIFLPGFRIAFMVMPDEMTTKTIAAKHLSDIFSSSLIQRTFDRLLREGLWEQHLGGMREIYRQKYLFFSCLLEEHLSGLLQYRLPEGGLNFWLSLPVGISSSRLFKHSQVEGVSFAPGSIFFADGKANRFFRLSIASLEKEQMVKGIEILTRVCRKLINEGGKKGEIRYTPLL